ncbi:TPA: iron-sulfur cluster assembly accessory protein [archaeon]|nr:iron-sulfur cluster assembly accessory protein [Candidatus Naiadarchaeales archaeon SRR2090153.bin461]
MEQHVQAVLITKQMPVSEVVEKWPSTEEIMKQLGLNCFGCDGAPVDSIEQVATSLGFQQERVNELLNVLNEEARKTPPRTSGFDPNAKYAVEITENAAKKINEIMKNSQKDGYGLKFGVKPGGCAGYSYGLDFQKEATAGEKTLVSHGVNVFVDEKSLPLVNEVIIDYVEALQGSGFKIKNPHAKKSCGCGKSDGF